MPDISYPAMINGLPVVTAPAEIDLITAEEFRMVLLQAAANGHATIVVDLTGTRFCDSVALKALHDAHRQALDDGGELRLALPTSGSVVRILAITGLNRCIPCFTGLDQALAAPQPVHPRQPARAAWRTVPVMDGMLPVTFTDTALTDLATEDRHDSNPATMRLAVAFIDEHAHTDISVADIADAAFVTIRAVQLAFRRHLDTTPTEYLRRVRLDRAHCDLLAADPGRETVTAVAYRWGFRSHSRFAAAYRRAYGVPPNHTLRRASGSAGKV